MNDELSIATIYKIFTNKSKLIYQFIALQNEYANEPREYGLDGTISMSEVTILISIEENPGITTTELAGMHRKTKAALSQTVKKLEQRGLVYRTRCPIDGKRVLLHINEAGMKITTAHRQYDLNNLRNTLDQLMEHATVEEVDAFFKVMELYINIIEKNLNERKTMSEPAEDDDNEE